MTNRVGARIACLISAATLGGCGTQQVEGPPTIRYGQSACTQCRMLINEERFAASLVRADGEVEVFDSVECLIQRLNHPSGPLKHVWVHDYDAPEWANAQDAFYVLSTQLATPMGQGLIALSTEQAALRLAAHARGRILRFEELQSHVASQEFSTAKEP